MCLAYINMFARLDENPAMTLQDIKETKRYGRMDALTEEGMDGQRENSIPITNKLFFLKQTPSCICSMCLHCIGKVSNCSIKSCGGS